MFSVFGISLIYHFTVFIYYDQVLSPCTVSTYCIIILTVQIILHSYIFSYITSDHIISCYRTYHHIAMLASQIISYLFTCHIQIICFMFHACKYQRSGYRKLIRARRRCTHCMKQWSMRARRRYTHCTKQWFMRARRRCGDPFGATVIQTGSMSSTQTGPRYQNKTYIL